MDKASVFYTQVCHGCSVFTEVLVIPGSGLSWSAIPTATPTPKRTTATTRTSSRRTIGRRPRRRRRLRSMREIVLTSRSRLRRAGTRGTRRRGRGRGREASREPVRAPPPPREPSAPSRGTHRRAPRGCRSGRPASAARRRPPGAARRAAVTGEGRPARPRAVHAPPPTPGGRARSHRRTSESMLVVGAAVLRPPRLELLEDAPAERVLRPCECLCDVSMQALERARAAGAAQAEVERRTAVAAGGPPRKLAADAA